MATTTSPATRPPATRDTWSVYQMMFADHLESVNAAPRTIETYGLAVGQLAAFLRAAGMP